MEYFVVGEITLDIDMEVEAESLEEAEKKDKAMCKEYYHLEVNNAYHEMNVRIDLGAGEYSE